MPFQLRHGDLTETPADALVNAANERLAPGGGVCGAIFENGFRVTSTRYSLRGPGFNSQHLPGGSQLSLTPVLGNMMPTFDLSGH